MSQVQLASFRQPKQGIIRGRHIDLRPLRADDAADLFGLVGGQQYGSLWEYMSTGPYDNQADLRSYLETCSQSRDPLFWAIADSQTGKCVGFLSFLRTDQANRTIEIGNIMYSPSLQRTTAATEAWYLLAKMAFDCGFRRLEWKCNDRNEPSKRAAVRLGHSYEGTFRQHMIVKGLNRDTAWFAILDSEWGLLDRALQDWMIEENFDSEGRQRKDLRAIREEL